jgi:hypothetical protein
MEVRGCKMSLIPSIIVWLIVLRVAVTLTRSQGRLGIRSRNSVSVLESCHVRVLPGRAVGPQRGQALACLDYGCCELGCYLWGPGSVSILTSLTAVRLHDVTDNGYPIQGADASKVLTICHDGDNICAHGDEILIPHLTYLVDADTAAEFVLESAGLSAGERC